MATIEKKEAKQLTLEQMKALSYGDHVYIACTNRMNKRYGQLLEVKINGQPKTWKQTPSKVQILYKYGLYEYGYITESDEVYIENGGK